MFEIKAKATKLIDDTGYPEVVLIEFYDYDGQSEIPSGFIYLQGVGLSDSIH